MAGFTQAATLAVVTDAFTIRPAQPADWPQFHPHLPHDQPVDSLEAAQARFERLLENPKCAVFVAELEGRIVGVAMAHEWHEYLMSGLKQIRFSTLVVSPEHRHKGIGRALFEYTRDWAHGIGATWFEWYASRSAISFYERMGFVGQSHPDEDHPYFEIAWERNA